MKKMYNIENLTYSFYNTFTLLMAEIMGRSYGGGVLELTPNEFKSLPVIYFDEMIDFNKFSTMFSNKKDIVDILMRFYHCTKREPRFFSTYTENDGSMHSNTGSLFDR